MTNFFLKHRCNCLMFWWERNTYFYIKRDWVNIIEKKWGLGVVFVVFNQQVVFFQFPPSRNYIAFTNILLSKKCNWIGGVKDSSWDLPFIILLTQNLFSCVTNFFSLILSAYYSYNNNNFSQLHFILFKLAKIKIILC